MANHLVAPGAVEGVFGDGKDFDVSEAKIFHVGNKLGSEFAVGEEAGTGFEVGNDDDGFNRSVRTDGRFVGVAVHPGAEVEFVDGDGFAEGFAVAPIVHPRLIVPGVGAEIGDDRGGFGAGFLLEAVGIGFFVDVSVVVFDFVFVSIACGDFRDEEFPDSRRAFAHLVLATVPVVEVAEKGDVAGGGCPDGKVDARDSVLDGEVGTEFFVDAVMVAFAEEVKVKFG